MNILYLCDEYPPCQHGGIGTTTQILAREMVKKGHKVWVCGFYPYYRKASVFEEDQGVKIYRLFYGTKLLLKVSKDKILGRIFNIKNKFNAYTAYITSIIRENKINIVEMPDFNEAFYYSGPCFISYPIFDIPSVIKLHGNFSFFQHIEKKQTYNSSIYKKEQFLINTSTKLLAISEFTRRNVKDIFNYNKEIMVIHNGIDASNLGEYIEKSPNTVVFAGTLAEKKGVINLIKAWRGVIEKIPSAKLLIYGKGGINFIPKIKAEISDKTKESIHLLGFVPRDTLSEIFRAASCAIFPSYAESFSMVPLESMKVGCPTIYTKRASGNELISNGIDGLLIDPDNIEEIINAIYLMLNDRTAAEKMGKNGASTIRIKFNIKSIADDHIKFYNTLINKENDSK